MSPHKKPQGDLELTRSDSQPPTLTDDMMMRERCDLTPGAGPSVLPVQPLVDAPLSGTSSSLGASRPPVALAVTSDRPQRSPSFVTEARQRERFLIFIKILFKSLDEREPHLHARAKRIVAECTRRNRLGEPDFDPLMGAIEQRLRHMVGETHWMRATAYLRHYMTHMRQRKAPAGAPTDRRARKQRQQEQD